MAKKDNKFIIPIVFLLMGFIVGAASIIVLITSNSGLIFKKNAPDGNVYVKIYNNDAGSWYLVDQTTPYNFRRNNEK